MKTIILAGGLGTRLAEETVVKTKPMVETDGKPILWHLMNIYGAQGIQEFIVALGYNLKLTDMRPALGLSLLKKLDPFFHRQWTNFGSLRACLAPLESALILPEATPNAKPSWFGFPITLREEARVDRNTLIRHLNARKAGTRLLLRGNLLWLKALKDIPCRVVGAIPTSDRIMVGTFRVGTYPGLTNAILDFIASSRAEGPGMA